MPGRLLGLAAAALGGVSALVVPQKPKQQSPLTSLSTFRETSIFRPAESFESMAEAEPPEFHLYDNFGKDIPMPGVATFAHLNWTNCFDSAADGTFDIGITGMPFDLGVSYRPGQRFGPAATRTAAQKMGPFISYSMAHDMMNPFRDWATVVDCGDIPNSVFDKYEAIQELGKGLYRMASRQPRAEGKGDHVRLITLGGDHTISEFARRPIEQC
jgi:agmatinase